MIKVTGKYSLKTKLGWLYAFLLILSVGMMGYFSYWDIWQLFIKNETTHVRATAKPVIAQWLKTEGLIKTDSVPVNFTPQKVLVLTRNLTSRHAVAVVLNRSGKIVANGKQLPEEPSPPAPNLFYVHKAFSGINDVTFWSKVNGKPVLVLLIPLRPQPDSRHIFGVLQISTTLSGINRILFRYGIMQLVAMMVILFLGIVFGFRFIGWSLKDLNRLSVTCREIAKGNFTKRAAMTNRKDEIGQLAVSFNIMVDRLEKTFQSQKRFVANAAHELLTPLTGLRGSLEVLLRGAGDDPETQNRLTKGMYQEINHLIRVCNRLLDLSRLENASHVNKQPVVLSTFFSGFKQQAGNLMKNRTMKIEKGPFLTVMADSDLLEQILLNLLTNAIRHSPENSVLTLGWKLLPGFVEIWFSNEGEGMGQETLSHVFEPFFSGENNDLAKKGTGLGLTLTRLMVEAQGGTIRIDSVPDKRTTVFFTLPL
jgi:signal transduction histidine kinase